MTTRAPFFLPAVVRDTSVSSVLPLIHRQERSPVKNESPIAENHRDQK